MKTLLIVLAAAGVAFGSAWFVASSQSAASTKREIAAAQEKLQAEKTALEAALAEARHQPVSSGSSLATPTVAQGQARLTAQEILEKLVAIRPGAGAARNRNIRLVVYYLESLAECRAEAVPVINNFFAQNQDIDYTTEDVSETPAAAEAAPNNGGRNGRNGNNNNNGGRGGNNGIWSFRRGGELRTDFVLPPSLRLGLVDVLKAIGGEPAEKVLASLLETSGRGIEICYVAKVLQEMTPDKYREVALASAKDLLTHPPTIDSPNRLDELSAGYLFDVLKMYNDTSFAAAAQNMLIGADGRIDRNALNYLTSVLKEQAIPNLYAAYLNPNLTNQWDKMQIGRDILGYAGDNVTANKMFNDTVADPNLDNRMKLMAIASVAGINFGGPGGGNNNGGGNVSAETYRSRIALLQPLLNSTDEQTRKMAELAIANATILSTNGTPENPGRALWQLIGGGGRGQGGNNRNGNGGGNNNGGGNGQ
ncbi:MAG: hypothetical protein RL380_1707 [Verrucomicrobiota bacterium]|jgi:hypothetical protein